MLRSVRIQRGFSCRTNVLNSSIKYERNLCVLNFVLYRKCWWMVFRRAQSVEFNFQAISHSCTKIRMNVAPFWRSKSRILSQKYTTCKNWLPYRASWDVSCTAYSIRASPSMRNGMVLFTIGVTSSKIGWLYFFWIYLQYSTSGKLLSYRLYYYPTI